MKTKVIKIGKSRGIKIPAAVLDKSGLRTEVELEVKENRIIIKPVSKRRDNWESSFKKMAKNEDDILLDKDFIISQTKWDEEEWEW